MIDIESETLMRVSELRLELNLKNAPHQQTIYNWIKDGRRGNDGRIHKLETVNVAGVIHTSKEAYYRFVRECSGEIES